MIRIIHLYVTFFRSTDSICILNSNRSTRLVVEKESKSVSIDLVAILLTDQSYIEFYETKYDIKDAIEGYEYFQ